MNYKVVVVLLLCFVLTCAVWANPAAAASQSEAKLSGTSAVDLTGAFSQITAVNFYITKWQRILNQNIALSIKELKEQKSPTLLFTIMGIAFIYGIFHAVGPGHGKSVITGWILAQKRSRKDILLVSSAAAFLHALSATLLVTGAYLIVGKFSAIGAQKLDFYLQCGAAALLLLIGLGMMFNFLRHKLIGSKSEQVPTKHLLEKPFIVALSIGMVPCPVTSVILIFSLSLGLVWQGILLVVFFAVGMGVSIFAIASVVWLLKEKITDKKMSVIQYLVSNLFPVVGGLFFVIVGSAILYSLLKI